MARQPQPWYRKERNAWYVMLEGKQHFIGDHPPDAARPRKRNGRWNAPESIRDAFDELRQHVKKKATENPTSGYLSDIFLSFLKWTKQNREQGTLDWYKQRLDEFDDKFHDLRVAQLRPHHVEEWVQKKNSDSHRRGCIIAVNRALNWAVKMGYIDRNPIKGMEKPAAGRRDVVLTDNQYKQLLEHCSDQNLKDLIQFCFESGCRPQEAFALEIRHLQLEHSRVVFPKEEAKGKKKARVIYLNDTAKEIIERLAAQRDSFLFVNANGDRWNRNNLSCRFARMKKKIGFKMKLYYLRHSWCDRMLRAGNDPITVATMAGHSDPSMLARIYQHVHQNTDHLMDALRRKK